MSTTVSGTLAKREEGPAAMITQYKADFGIVLPSTFKPETFVRLAQGQLRRDAKLRQAAEANPASLLVALLECARLGHEPGTDEFALIGRLKGKNGPYVQGIEEYRGIVKRMFNSGTVDSIVAEAVHERDRFEWRPGDMQTPQHIVDDWFGDRGRCIGAYAYAIFKGGAISKVVVIGQKRIDRARQASESANSEYSPWNNDLEKMTVKTALRDLEPYVPKSAEALIREQEAQTAADNIRTMHELPPPVVDEVIDLDTGEVINQ